MNFACAYSSSRDDWETPDDLYRELSDIFDGFDVDFYASDSNHKAPVYFTKENPYVDDYEHFEMVSPDDGYISKIFMNPPYGKTITEACSWARYFSAMGCIVVMLIPARTDTKWFHEYIYNQKNVYPFFLNGRVKFKGAKNRAPFPSMVVYFLPYDDMCEHFAPLYPNGRCYGS